MKILIVDDIKSWRDHHFAVLRETFSDAEFQFADSARSGYDKLLENNNAPFNLILTDMQMETDFEPKYAGEWFIEQIKTFKNYKRTKIVIVSAAYNINYIAEKYGVLYLRKSTATNFPETYKSIIL